MPASLPTNAVPSLPVRREFSFFSVVLLPVLIGILIFGGLEIFARSRVAAMVLPLHSYGNYHAQFEIKWQKLEEFVQQNGGVDVILLGSSMVNTGIDPLVFSAEYEKLTGIKAPRVFNFGVEGLTVTPNSKIAVILHKTFSPSTIVFFTEMRDYVSENGKDIDEKMFSDAWLSYRYSNTGIAGWAIDHSKAIQLLLVFKRWNTPRFLDEYLVNVSRMTNTSGSGYEPETKQRNDIDIHPDSKNPDDSIFFSLYDNFSIDPFRLESLHNILNLHSDYTSVFVTEIPAHFTFYDYFGGEAVHAEFISHIQQFVMAEGGFFIQPVCGEEIPLDGRADRLHLNQEGANLFSRLLAYQFFLACKTDHYCLQGN